MSKNIQVGKKLPKNLNQASKDLKVALSAFEMAFDREKFIQDQKEKKIRKQMLLKIKTLLKELT